MSDGINFIITIMVPIMELLMQNRQLIFWSHYSKQQGKTPTMTLVSLKEYMLLVQDSTIIFHPFLQSYRKLHNDLTMDLTRRIVNYTGNKGSFIKNTMMLSSKIMIDEEQDEIIKKYFGHSAPFQPGTFRGPSEVDISLSQTRIAF